MNADWTPYIAMATSILRHGVTALGAFGFTWAQTVSGSQIEMLVSAVAIIASTIWGIVQKQNTKAALNVATLLPPAAPPPKVPV